MKKQVWFDARNTSFDDTKILPLVYNSDINVLVVRAENKDMYKAPLKTVYVVEVSKQEELEALQKENIVLSGDEEILQKCRLKGYKTCVLLSVDDRDSLEKSWKIGSNYDFLLIDFKCETNIPLELIIARLQKSNTILLKKVKTAEEAEIAFGVMEHGSDGVMLTSDSMEEIVMLKKVMQKRQTLNLPVVPARVKSIEHIGMGYRACIDTTSLLNKNEGMIIGSTSQGGILVSSETHYLPYMNLRPFRVNAGAVHSYVWCPENTTEYITDLQSGSKVLVFDNAGNVREVSVGRIKIEMRPLLKITVEASDTIINTIVQDDWHIRVLGINGEPYNVSALTSDTILAAYICKSGRHVGIEIDENIIEK